MPVVIAASDPRTHYAYVCIYIYIYIHMYSKQPQQLQPRSVASMATKWLLHEPSMHFVKNHLGTQVILLASGNHFIDWDYEAHGSKQAKAKHSARYAARQL